jgi:hypothetical protein
MLARLPERGRSRCPAPRYLMLHTQLSATGGFPFTSAIPGGAPVIPCCPVPNGLWEATSVQMVGSVGRPRSQGSQGGWLRVVSQRPRNLLPPTPGSGMRYHLRRQTAHLREIAGRARIRYRDLGQCHRETNQLPPPDGTRFPAAVRRRNYGPWIMEGIPQPTTGLASLFHHWTEQ